MTDHTTKLLQLCEIMEKAHTLAEVAWPRDGCGRNDMPNEGLLDIQEAALKAPGLPDDVPLMTGDPLLDIYGN